MNMENNTIKILIHIKDVSKPIVLSSNNIDKADIIKKIMDILDGKINTLEMDSGDIFICPDYKDIKSVLITTDK